MEEAGADIRVLCCSGRLCYCLPRKWGYQSRTDNAETQTNGFAVFVKGHWAVPDFIFAYFSLVAFVVPYIGYNIYVKSWRWAPLTEVDLFKGKAEIDELEETQPPMATGWLAKFNRWLWG